MIEQAQFGGLTIAFDDLVLRPREWTTAQSEWAAHLLTESSEGPVLELCAGVGQIGLLAVVKQPRCLVMVDSSPRACELARRNIDAVGAPGVEVREAALEHALRSDEKFVGVIADPPWVPRADVQRFPEDPTSAIDGGPEGLDVARACLTVAGDHLVDGGWLLIQLGNRSQAEELAEWSVRSGLGFEEVEVREYDRGVLMLLERLG